MKNLTWLILLAVVATITALFALTNGGYVLLVLPPWRIELSLNLLPILLIIAFLAFYTALRSYAALRRLPDQARAYQAQRQQQQAHQTLFEATRLLFEGRVGQSLKKASEAYLEGAPQGLASLIAARSAQRLRNGDLVEPWVDRAIREDKNCATAALILKAETEIDQRRFADALQTLKKLQKQAGRHIATLRLELRAQQGAHNWESVLQLARQLEKRDAINPHYAETIKQKAHIETLRHWKDDASALLAYLRKIPANEKNARIVQIAAQILSGLEANDAAQKLLETLLDERHGSEWEPQLIELYGRLPGGDVTGRIARAERWLQQSPRDASLLLTLGRLCIKQSLWGKAQSYLEASLSQQETREAHLELARLLDQTDKPEAAHPHFKQAALLDRRGR